jgi:4-amino-4-deoxy-L-arabinose transferase-like glycosyltransferase
LKTIFNNKTFQIYFLVFLTLLILLGRQLDTGMKNYDDAFYAQKAKEVYESRDLWVITFAGVPDFANPPLPLWCMALAYSVFGISSFSAIFPSALFGVGIVLLTYRLASHFYKDSWIAFVASLVLISPGIFIDYSRRAMVDIPLTFFVAFSLFAFLKAKTNKLWYLVFGLATAGGILSKSVLGIFPLAIVFLYLLLNRQWKELINPFLALGAILALGLGFSWHWINWLVFEQLFLDVHFGALLFGGDCGNSGFRCNFSGYLKDFLEYYWPWLPFALIGLYKFGKSGFIEKDENSLFLFVWPTLVFVVLSTSNNQTIRYLFMIFPALSIIVAKTLYDWLVPVWKERVVAGLAGVACLTALFVNSTPFQVKVTLKESSNGVRQLASIIKLNIPENEMLGNFKLDFWRPKHSMLFYSDRDMEPPINKEELLRQSQDNPKKMWLSGTAEFKSLNTQAPGYFYLIQANSKYAFFTSSKNRDFVLYDFSGMKIPNVK